MLDRNPLDDIHNTNTVRYTMVNGRLYDSLSMNEIGHYDRPRGRFYWELADYSGIEWNESTSNMTDEDFKREQKAGAILVDV